MSPSSDEHHFLVCPDSPRISCKYAVPCAQYILLITLILAVGKMFEMNKLVKIITIYR